MVPEADVFGAPQRKVFAVLGAGRNQRVKLEVYRVGDRPL